MQLIQYPSRNDWRSILQRPIKSFEAIEKEVIPVLKAVKHGGDKALFELTEKFDQVKIDSLIVTNAEIVAASNQISDELKKALAIAYDNIYKFHFAQKTPIEKSETMPGVVCWRKSVGIQKVGFYIPGGTAPLFSTILMLAIPAKIADCAEMILCTPPDKNGDIHPAILYAAQLCGVAKIFKVGGSQAIAAMAYGTESIPQVYKIFGPGNQYVMAAKQLVNKDGIAIDMPAGPSEVAIFADESANPSFVAADLLSQAEHGADSQVILVSTDIGLINETIIETEKQLLSLPRVNFASKALENSKAILVKDDEEAIEIINAYAPEHLIISTRNDELIGDKIVNAGSIFLGKYTPEAAGDYASGTNHTLPTNGYATAYSGVSLDTFYKKITFQSISEEGLKNIGPTIETLAANEMLDAHKNAVTIRLESLKNKI
ncbi:MAG: histidinol dehydrogenase [Cytophagales bacterium]